MNASDHNHLPNPQGASGMKPQRLTHDEHRAIEDGADDGRPRWRLLPPA
jgi:hypothetical protein